jgi:hypothetical protein
VLPALPWSAASAQNGAIVIQNTARVTTAKTTLMNAEDLFRANFFIIFSPCFCFILFVLSNNYLITYPFYPAFNQPLAGIAGWPNFRPPRVVLKVS